MSGGNNSSSSAAENSNEDGLEVVQTSGTSRLMELLKRRARLALRQISNEQR